MRAPLRCGHRRPSTPLVVALLALGSLVATACSSGDDPANAITTSVHAVVGTAPATTPAPTPPIAPAPAPAPFALPAARRAELERAGMGWLLDVEYPAQPPGVRWPTDSWPTGPLPDGVDGARIRAIVNHAFRPAADPAGGRVDALLAVSGGRLVLEAYNDWVPNEPHPSWSMAKSITHGLLGILVAEGRLDPFRPAAVPEWSRAGDSRHDITVDALLHMRSGLAWQEEYAGTSDVISLLFGEGQADRAHFAASKPLRHEPGTRFSYSTGTSVILSRIIADHVGYGEDGTAWAQSALFDPLGITTVAHDLDGIGVMSGGSHDMSAQDFARFGLLYLRGGMWDGEQVVPRAWVDYARLPHPDAPDYGAHWWVGGADGKGPLSFFADGFAGQLMVIVPSLDLVVLALADTQDGRSDRAAHALVRAFAAAAAA